MQRRQTLTYFFAFIALGLTAAILGPALPGLAKNTGSTVGQIGILFTAQALGYLAGSFLSGWRFDRAPAHPFLAGLLLLLAASLALTPVMPLLSLLFVLLFLAGVAQSSLDVGGNTLLVWVHGDQVGPRMNGLHFFFGLGALLSPLLVAQVLTLTGGIAWAYWLLALVVLLPAAILAVLPSPAAPQPAGDANGKPVSRLLVGLIALMFFLFVGAELGYGGWIYTYALETGLADLRTAGYLNSLFWVGLTLGRLIAIPLSTRMRPATILAIDFAGILLFLAVALAWPTTPAVIWGATFGTGLAMASVFPGLMNLAGVHLPITGRITGWFLVGSSLGSMVVPWLMGQGIERAGPQSALAILFGASFLAALVFALFLLVVRRRAGVAAAWAG